MKAVTLACALLSLLVTAATAHASYPGERNGRIAFVKDGYIWTAKPDGTKLKRLVRGRDPSYSPSGKRIAYSRRGDIWIVRSNGTNRRQVTDNDRREFDPTWSPKGKRLAFADGDGNIYLVRAREGHGAPALLVERGPCGENCLLEEHFAPAWGVDDYIYFTTHLQYDDPLCAERWQTGRIDPATERRTVRVDNAVLADPDPRARALVYSDLRLQPDCTYAETANLVVTEIEGGPEGPASHAVTQLGDDRADADAVFAPTGRRIAFARRSFAENRTDVYTIKRNGTKLRLVARDASSPTWQPRQR